MSAGRDLNLPGQRAGDDDEAVDLGLPLHALVDVSGERTFGDFLDAVGLNLLPVAQVLAAAEDGDDAEMHCRTPRLVGRRPSFTKLLRVQFPKVVDRSGTQNFVSGLLRGRR